MMNDKSEVRFLAKVLYIGLSLLNLGYANTMAIHAVDKREYLSASGVPVGWTSAVFYGSLVFCVLFQAVGAYLLSRAWMVSRLRRLCLSSLLMLGSAGALAIRLKLEGTGISLIVAISLYILPQIAMFCGGNRRKQVIQ
jgi:hypothetical protein